MPGLQPSIEIRVKDIVKLYKDHAKEPYSFLVNNMTL